MASPIEEKFVMERLRGSSVFEFGCSPGKLATEISRRGYSVVGVDLYEPEQKEEYSFIRCDLVKMMNSGILNMKSDNVIAVSSIEHSGIESDNFINGDGSVLDYHFLVASYLMRLVDTDGQLIVTVPFGTDDVYFVNKNGDNGRFDEIKDPSWGYRTFTEEAIVCLFRGMSLVDCEAYEKVDGMDYFDIASWKETSLEDYNKYDNKNRAVMCCVFKR